jgi:hypothetical protein
LIKFVQLVLYLNFDKHICLAPHKSKILGILYLFEVIYKISNKYARLLYSMNMDHSELIIYNPSTPTTQITLFSSSSFSLPFFHQTPVTMAQARSLHELLQEPQEPFYVDAFLIERGYSTKLLEGQEGLPFCWPRNATKNQFRLRTVDFTRKRGGFGKEFLSKFIYRKIVKKAIKCEKKALKDGMASQNRERILNSCCFVEESESETKKHSPISVLEMHSYAASLADSNGDVLSTSIQLYFERHCIIFFFHFISFQKM